MQKLFFVFFCFMIFGKSIFANMFTEPELAEKVGDKVQIAVPLYAFFITGVHNDLKGTGGLAISIIGTQTATEFLKRVVLERRPNGSNRHSFPSGHSAGAFSGATFIHKRYGFKEAIVPYILATYVGFSRVIARKHYTHDVIAGAAIAGAVNYFFVDEFDSSQSISLDRAKSGFMLSYRKNF